MHYILIIVLVIFISHVVYAEDNPYPLYTGQYTNDKELRNPVNRHKQIMEQLMRIECAVYYNFRNRFPNKNRKALCTRYEKKYDLWM